MARLRIPPSQRPLGRREPTDDRHVGLYPYRAPLLSAPPIVETIHKLPVWHWTHDQGREGSCVGHTAVMERAIANTAQNALLKIFRPTRRYDPISIWNAAKEIDEWADTNPGDDNGTSIRAAYDVLRDRGARRVFRMAVDAAQGVPKPIGLKDWDVNEGVLTNRWARTVDEMRDAIYRGNSISIGVNWYREFDKPERFNSRTLGYSKVSYDEHWIAQNGILTRSRGGHAVCVYGASDRREAFKIKNSWGRDYPLVWLPYKVMERLLQEDGEACLVSDR